jgi:Protein of unknown function (DUF3489)
MTLTDTRPVLLSAASQREDGGIELARDLTGGAAHRVVGKLLSQGLIAEIPARDALSVWRRDDWQGRLALRITQRGLAAIRVEDGAMAEDSPNSKQAAAAVSDKRPGRVAASRGKKKRGEASQASVKARHGGSKQARVIAMLQTRRGTSIAAITKATGWQPQSVRGFFAAVVRRKLGLTLVSEKTGEERVYRIVARDAAAKRKGKSGRKAA